MFLVVKILGSDDYRKRISKCANLVTGLLTMSAGIDVIIAAATLYYLFEQRGKASVVKCVMTSPSFFCLMFTQKMQGAKARRYTHCCYHSCALHYDLLDRVSRKAQEVAS